MVKVLRLAEGKFSYNRAFGLDRRNKPPEECLKAREV